MARKVKSTGPTPCPYLLISERPGRVDERTGKAMSGPVGQELDHYLFANAGIGRDSIHVMNLIDTYSDEPPSEEEIQSNLHNVNAEIEAVNPDYTILMGSVSVRVGLGHDIDIEWANGLMFPSARRSCLVMPIFPVSASLNQPRYATRIAWAFDQFGKRIRGADMPMGHLEDGHPDPTYGQCREIVASDIIGVDTEGSPSAPWCISVSRGAGTGCVLRRGRVDIVDAMVVGHNFVHDIQVLEAMGITIGTFTDTMTMASLLGTEPLGLKLLARRWCAMTMQDYADVIAPAKRDIALEYLGKVLDIA